MKRALAFLVLVSFVCMGQSIPKSKEPMSSEYRNIVTLDGTSVAVNDTTLRFPSKATGVNQCLPSGLPEFYTSVNWAHTQEIVGSVPISVIIYSRIYPAGADTQKVTANVRAFSGGGSGIDSMRVLGFSAATLRIYVTD